MRRALLAFAIAAAALGCAGIAGERRAQPGDASLAGWRALEEGHAAEAARAFDARLSTRKQDLVIAYPWQHDEEIVYKLPAGWTLRAGEAKKEVSSPFGHLTVEITSAPGGLVRVHTFLDVTRFRIPPAEYAAFRAFLGDIDSVFAERIGVGPGGGAS